MKFAEELDEKKKFHESDSITKYLLNLANTKNLKKTTITSEIPTKLLLLEKAGVDTSEFYNKIVDASLDDADAKIIDEKFKSNCDTNKLNKKDTDLHEYVIYVNKNKLSPMQTENDKEGLEKYVDDLRSSFIDFLTDVVMKDFEKENEQITPQNLIDFYFKNREKYESDLDEYNLMLGQTEGIISDKDFVDDLSDDFEYESGEMKRHGE